MAIIGDVLRQAFMPKHEYESLREEEKAWGRLQRLLAWALAAGPFCRDRRIQELPMNVTPESDLYGHHGAFYLTDEEAADYYWMVVFIPSAIVCFASVIYLLAGKAWSEDAMVSSSEISSISNCFIFMLPVFSPAKARST